MPDTTEGKTLFQNTALILLGSLGGYLLSLTGISIGWMIGTLITTGFISYWRPKWLFSNVEKGIKPYWRHIGQWILGIELGQQVTLSVLDAFEDNWSIIMTMLILSIVFALLSGVALWKYSNTNLLTSLFATTPGGISAMPSIADEVGANPVVVSIVQLIRIILVVSMIPLVASYWHTGAPISHHAVATIAPTATLGSVKWTVILAASAWVGYRVGKHIKIPAPWLVGGMIGVAVTQTVGTSLGWTNLQPWWPHWFIVVAQIFIGASIGSRLNKNMFTGAKHVVIVGLLTSLGLVFSMVLCAIVISKIADIPLVTSVLAFAPGGVAEMATTSLALHADATFVVAVQVLRLITVFMIIPPLFRVLNRVSLHQKRSI